MTSTRNCPDCGVPPGQEHRDGCDVERCAACGLQRISCGCPEAAQDSLPRLPWTGEWPGDADAREADLWCLWVDGRGWVPCTRETPGARPDLNRLVEVCRWDRDQGKWVRPMPWPNVVVNAPQTTAQENARKGTSDGGFRATE